KGMETARRDRLPSSVHRPRASLRGPPGADPELALDVISPCVKRAVSAQSEAVLLTGRHGGPVRRGPHLLWCQFRKKAGSPDAELSARVRPPSPQTSIRVDRKRVQLSRRDGD